MAPSEEVIKIEKTPHKGKKGLIFIIIALILLLFLAVAYFALRTGLLFDLFFSPEENSRGASSRRAEVARMPEYMYEMPEILVNLDEGAGRGRFLSVKFFIGYDNPKLQQTLDKRMPELRDAVLTLLWQRNSEDIRSPEGKERLREEIYRTIDALLDEDGVVGIYFWHIMIQ